MPKVLHIPKLQKFLMCQWAPSCREFIAVANRMRQKGMNVEVLTRDQYAARKRYNQEPRFVASIAGSGRRDPTIGQATS